MSAAYISMFPEATEALVPADAAVNCLKSIPVDVEEDKALIEEITLFTNWISNLGYLSNPPKGYPNERIDLSGELKRLHDELDKGTYEDEYTFQVDLKTAFDRTYDFHTFWIPDILSVFTFNRGNIGEGLNDEFAVVSVSTDGKSLPKIYNYYDILVADSEGWTPSPIVKINDQPAEDFLKDWSKQFQYLEDHARYNNLFPNQPDLARGITRNQFGTNRIFTGDTTKVEHENGTVHELIGNAAIPLNALDGVDDAQSFFDRFLNLGPPQTTQGGLRKRGAAWRDEQLRKNALATKVKRQLSEPTATGYPVPVMLHSEAVIGGYYLSGQGYDNVAVLSIPSFQPTSDAGVEEFQDLIGQFLERASKAGKTRLVIDLRGNGGGFANLGYDLFKQLFPEEDPWVATRFRANEAFDILGQFLEAALQDVTYEIALADFKTNGLDGNIAFAYQTMFNYKVPLTVDGKNFTSWAQYFGPHEVNGDKVTTVARKDFNNFFSDDLAFDVTGYASRAGKLKKQFFKGDSIVMLQDGGCGSTCALFAEQAKMQGKVQQVVVGGLPETGPMEGVAGSKGAQVLNYLQIWTTASRPYQFLQDQQEALNRTELGRLIFAQRPFYRVAWADANTPLANVNIRDNIRKGDESETPLEFVYEAADYRVFYTAEMVRSPEAVWKKAVDARWGDSKQVSVEGSTGHPSSLSGGLATSPKKKGAASNATSGLNSAFVAALAVIVSVVVMV
ncbi:uncharacterized protein EI97DRAFT_439551 [Westerdykella ornata]|uniref:Uncharacterized protein n=1 Tax=Westerdykella ornata TaxID=318751 RepID=A0A6A6JZP7_WESOR|nr:uncharacterized protein EI97DRAFT_439551 [Westerdykella ornata]KAF2280549.1 hypothetical protein EI97DRAFT_439551 [Westerdykella ornata]